jgi:hypothetical protein
VNAFVVCVHSHASNCSSGKLDENGRKAVAGSTDEKIERDFLLARDELVQVRDQKAMLEVIDA